MHCSRRALSTSKTNECCLPSETTTEKETHAACCRAELQVTPLGCNRADDQVEANTLLDNSLLSFLVMSVWQAERIAFDFSNCREQAANFWPSNLEFERRSMFSVWYVWFVDWLGQLCFFWWLTFMNNWPAYWWRSTWLSDNSTLALYTLRELLWFLKPH